MVLFFKGLANETRLSLLRTLNKRPMSVSELCTELDYEQSRVSHNL
ncbi:MAG: ArsR/SmtB family transcription factor, partial [Candidatus Thorarchaeota archaeon]